MVIKQLGQKQLHTRRAQLGVSVLLFQDLAVVPLLVMIPILARPDPGQRPAGGDRLGHPQGAVCPAEPAGGGQVAAAAAVSRGGAGPPDELFVLSALLVALLAASLTQWMGLSMALGPFWRA